MTARTPDDTRLTSLAASLPSTIPFVGPEAMERARKQGFAARLGANESVFGPSPGAVAAMRAAAAGAWMYPDPEAQDLRADLAAHHRCHPSQIVVGEGIDGLLGWLVRLTIERGTPVVTSDGAYPTFNYHVAGHGGVLHKVPYRDDAEDPAALIATATRVGARLIYLANPDNPMGSVHGDATILGTVDAVPPGALLILDEAYIGCDADRAGPPIDPADTRVIRLRTFSKAYGLAGLRIGYAIGPATLIAAFDRVRNHFGVGRLAQEAARAALGDAPYLASVQTRIAASRAKIARIGSAHGLIALPSAANFVALDCGNADRAGAILAGLLARGIFVRAPGVAPLNRCVRISCGTAGDMDVLEKAVAQVMATL